MKSSKWTFYQLLGLIALIVLFIFTEGLKKNFSASSSSNLSLVSTAGMIFLLVTWLYLMFYFQLKKKPQIMDHKVWKFMPLLVVGVLFLSMVTLMLLLMMGPMDEWVEQWRGLIYGMMMYFILLFYFFVIALVHKLSDSKDNVIHHSYLWTLGLLLIVIFII